MVNVVVVGAPVGEPRKCDRSKTVGQVLDEVVTDSAGRANSCKFFSLLFLALRNAKPCFIILFLVFWYWGF